MLSGICRKLQGIEQKENRKSCPPPEVPEIFLMLYR